MLLVKRVETIEEFAGLREAWKELYESSGIRSTFLTWEWLFTWWKHFGTRKELYLLTAMDGDRLVGIAPLMRIEIYKRGFKVRKLCSMANLDTDVSGFIYPCGGMEILRQLCKFIIGIQGQWDILELSDVPRACLDPMIFKDYFHPKDFHFLCKPSVHYNIQINCDWENYQREISSHFKRNIRRRKNMLKEDGKSYSITHLRDEEIQPEHMDTIFDIQSNSRYPCAYETPQEKTFHKDLIAVTGKMGWPGISIIFLDEEPAAYEYGFIYHDRFEFWHSGFDARFEQYTPGNILLLNMIENFCSQGIQELDMLRGDEGYKKRWNSKEQSYHHLQIIKKKSFRCMALYAWLPALKKHIKNIPPQNNHADNDRED